MTGLNAVNAICPMFGITKTYHMERRLNWVPSVGDTVLVCKEVAAEVKYRRYDPKTHTLQIELKAITIMNAEDTNNKVLEDLAKKAKEAGWAVTEFKRL